MPNGSPVSTKNIYTGNDNGTYVNWVNSGNPFSTTAYGYLGTVNTLGWVSCAEQVGTGAHTVSFTSTTDYLTNVGIFIYVPASKTLIQAYNQTATGIPANASVKIVLMAVDNNGDLFSWTDSRTISGNTPIDVTLTATTDAALTSYLNSL